MRFALPAVHFPVLLLLGCLGPSALPQERVSPAQFEEAALRALPVEPSYDFIRQHTEGLPPLPRDPAARPRAGEMEVSARGWKLLIAPEAGEVLRTAAAEFTSYMQAAMQVRLEQEKMQSLAGWVVANHAIVAGTRDQMPGCGRALRGRKDYEIQVAPGRVAVCGYDERGAMYGLYNLESRFSLREAPFLPNNLEATRHSLYQARMTLSGLGWMRWPDRYLAALARAGFDSIHASIYRNPNNAPGVGPHWDKMKTHPPGQMKDLLRRAARYGLDVYVPILYLYTGTPENEEGLRKLVRDIVREFPEIRGYVLLTEGFFYRTWFGAGGQGSLDLREWGRNWARGVAIVTEECRKLNPNIEVLPWEYNIDFRPEQAETKAYVVSQLPEYSIPLLTFENGKSFELDGQKGYLRDYAINQVGPAEVTIAQLEVAAHRKMRAVYSKSDTFASWQFGTFPYLPFPYQWYKRYEALRRYRIQGTLETWSYGFKPNFVAELRAWYSWSDAPPLEDLLRAIARRDFGAGSEDLVLAAWKHFSEAIEVFPDTGPNWGTNNAVACPFFLEKPEPRAMTLEYSWNDQDLWSRESQLNPYWPYVPRRLMLWPDFTNRVNVAERYPRFFTLPVFQKYIRLAADRMEEGLASYRQAALRAPEAKRPRAFREVLLAEQLERMMRSENALLEFEDLRFRFHKTQDRVERRRILDRMKAILEGEKVRTASSLAAAKRDSRLGWEWEQDYIYNPNTLEEKLGLLEVTLNQQMPAFLRKHGLQ